MCGGGGVQGKTLLKNMYAMFVERDCTLVEINPLAETPEGRGACASGFRASCCWCWLLLASVDVDADVDAHML